MSIDSDHSLVRILEMACARARDLIAQSELPNEDVPSLKRSAGEWEYITETEIDWRRSLAEMTRGEGFWEEMALAVDEVRSDERIEMAIGFDSDIGMRSQALWGVIAPIVRYYGTQRPDWAWDEAYALELISDWREGDKAKSYAKQTIAPLHNCKGMGDVEIEPGLWIRRFTDADRIALWRSFGAEHFPAPIHPNIIQLDQWEFAIDYRWELPRKPPLSDHHGHEVVRDTVRALRLHHAGVTGTSIVWTRPDSEHPWRHDSPGSSLYAPHESHFGLYRDQLKTEVGPHCGEGLSGLLTGLHAVVDNPRIELALRRFDSAYGRLDPEDRLIDLWITFEALLIPDGQHELSYRAGMRIAQLVGGSSSERQESFELARSSYSLRSKVVHGELVKDLSLVAKTRELARQALRTWILRPPEEDVKTLDFANFE